jgi:hypothetical protein
MTRLNKVIFWIFCGTVFCSVVYIYIVLLELVGEMRRIKTDLLPSPTPFAAARVLAQETPLPTPVSWLKGKEITPNHLIFPAGEVLATNLEGMEVFAYDTTAIYLNGDRVILLNPKNGKSVELFVGDDGRLMVRENSGR